MSLSARALLSVSDKSGLVDFARRLDALGYELVSTGGTFRTLRDAGISVTYVSDITEHPEVFDGRVKTLHPKIHGGILMRRDLDAHAAEAEAQRIRPIDLVVVNLYPFEATIAKADVTVEDAIENIDIGGPTLLRAAAKNHAAVTVVCDPADYDQVATALEADTVHDGMRRALALKAFRHTASYDAAIATYLDRLTHDGPLSDAWHAPLTGGQALRYGENPHQAAALYQRPGQAPLGGASLLQGKALSYNNIIDLDAATAIVAEFEGPTVVIVKHTNPCGVGRDADDIESAYVRALEADPVSAFGGIVAINRPVCGRLAARLKNHFFEVIVAPAFDAEAREVLGTKKNLRLIEADPAALREPEIVRPTRYGTLVQTPDPKIKDLNEDWTVATKRAPTEDEAIALKFLWRVAKHVKSNAIVLGSHQRTFGVGAGQMSRVDAAELAVKKSTGDLVGAAMASDAFFPFADGLEVAAKAGVTAVIQPGGSKRDQEVIDAADRLGVAMVFTGNRHFRH